MSTSTIIWLVVVAIGGLELLAWSLEAGEAIENALSIAMICAAGTGLIHSSLRIWKRA